MIVRWGLEQLPDVLDELGVDTPLLVAGPRWDELDLPFEPHARWTEVPSHRIDDVSVHARAGDSIVALGGGSAIDLGKAVSAAVELPLVSIPTTYAGAEWTTYYGGHDDDADEHALAGAGLSAESLPRVVGDPQDRDARTTLLQGACHAGAALGGSMLALGHAMAQAVGGRYGLPHGTLNGICLPAALRYNARHAPEALRRFGEAIGGEPASRVEQLAALGGPTRLRDLGVPEEDLPELATAAAQRAGNQANPHPATPAEIEQLLRSVW